MFHNGHVAATLGKSNEIRLPTEMWIAAIRMENPMRNLLSTALAVFGLLASGCAFVAAPVMLPGAISQNHGQTFRAKVVDAKGNPIYGFNVHAKYARCSWEPFPDQFPSDSQLCTYYLFCYDGVINTTKYLDIHNPSSNDFEFTILKSDADYVLVTIEVPGYHTFRWAADSKTTFFEVPLADNRQWQGGSYQISDDIKFAAHPTITPEEKLRITLHRTSEPYQLETPTVENE
jgi:hypothetical protein